MNGLRGGKSRGEGESEEKQESIHGGFLWPGCLGALANHIELKRLNKEENVARAVRRVNGKSTCSSGRRGLKIFLGLLDHLPVMLPEGVSYRLSVLCV
jgi:hypothetical protein